MAHCRKPTPLPRSLPSFMSLLNCHRHCASTNEVLQKPTLHHMASCGFLLL